MKAAKQYSYPKLTVVFDSAAQIEWLAHEAKLSGVNHKSTFARLVLLGLRKPKTRPPLAT